jgi:hypothetical protein
MVHISTNMSEVWEFSLIVKLLRILHLLSPIGFEVGTLAAAKNVNLSPYRLWIVNP